MDELAFGLGMSKKNIYEQFHNKNELIDAVCRMYVTELTEKAESVMSDTTGVLEKLSGIMSLMAQQTVRVNEHAWDDLRKCRPELWEVVREAHRRKLWIYLASCLDEGKRLKLLRSDVDNQAFLLAYLGGLERLLQPEVLVENSFSSDEASRSIVLLLLEGMIRRSGDDCNFWLATEEGEPHRTESDAEKAC